MKWNWLKRSRQREEAADDEDESDLEWIDEESIFEDDLDERRYSIDDGDPEFADEEDDLSEEEDLWPL